MKKNWIVNNNSLPLRKIYWIIMQIGDEIHALRTINGWSKRRLAIAAGVSVTQITKIETGQIDPRVSTVHKLAAALGAKIISI